MKSTYHADIVSIQQELRELDLGTGVVAERKLVQCSITRVTCREFRQKFANSDGDQRALLRGVGAKATKHSHRRKKGSSKLENQKIKARTTLSRLP